MQVRVEPQIGGRALHDGDGARLRAVVAIAPRVEGVHRRDEEVREVGEERVVCREAGTPRKREREHPLAQRDRGQDVVDEVRRGRAPAPPHARGAEAAALAAERDEAALVAASAPDAREAAAEKAAIEVGVELLPRVLRNADAERAVFEGGVERVEVVAHAPRRAQWSPGDGARRHRAFFVTVNDALHDARCAG